MHLSLGQQLVKYNLIGYNKFFDSKTNMTYYNYKFENGFVEQLKTEGFTSVWPPELLIIKMKHDKKFAHSLVKLTGGISYEKRKIKRNKWY